jgi:hypothetical protein
LIATIRSPFTAIIGAVAPTLMQGLLAISSEAARSQLQLKSIAAALTGALTRR